jgi:hypothetical protein
MIMVRARENVCKLEATDKKGRAGAKCFTGEAKVKQETNEINDLQEAPPPSPHVKQNLTGRYHRIRGVVSRSRYWHTASHASPCDYGNPDLLKIWAI